MIRSFRFGPARGFCAGFLFLCGGASGFDLGGGVEAEDTEVVGGLADFGEGGVEEFGFVGFDFEDEAVGPGLAVDGAAFDFAEIDVVAREGFESGEQRAGAMRELHCDGHFARVGGGSDCGGVGFAAEQDEAREIFGVVLDFFGEDHAVVVIGGPAAGDCGGNRIAAAEYFADAAGGIFGGDALVQRMLCEEAFALRERHRMRRDGFDLVERRAGDCDEIELDGKNRFGGDGEPIFEHEVIDADDRAGQRIFDGDEQRVGGVFRDGAEDGIERGARNGGDFGAKELDGGGFAEGAGLALEGYAKRFRGLGRVRWLCWRRIGLQRAGSLGQTSVLTALRYQV